MREKNNFQLLHFRVAFLMMALSFICPSESFAHKQPTHQYIVREAYKLLKKQVGSIPDMESHVGGTSEGRTPPNHWSLESTLVAGAWREDEENPINGKSDLWNVSTSHFWLADAGDNAPVLIVFPIIAGGDFDDNSFTKIMQYANGGWTVIFRRLLSRPFNVEQHYTDYFFRYNNLVDFYKTGNITYIGSVTITMYYVGGVSFHPNPANPPRASNFETETGWSVDDRKGIAYYILGRMCHLLGDMGLPVHAHMQQHFCPVDIYENGMDVEADHTSFPLAIDANSVFENDGGFIDATTCTGDKTRDPIHYLMYTANELSDHFASFGHSGNDLIGGNHSTKEFNDVQNLLSSAGEITSGIAYIASMYTLSPPCNGQPVYDNLSDIDNIRNKTFSYSIRATAGLLYWFAVETGQLESTSCTSDLFIQNQNFTQNPYTFIAQNIHAGNNVDAGQTAGDVSITGTANVLFRASVSIDIENGFHANPGPGGSFHAVIEDCPAPCISSSAGSDNHPPSGIISHNQGDGISADTVIGDETKYLLIPISVVANENTAQLSVYPNPANNLLNIDYSTDQGDNLTLEIYDILGVLKHTFVNETNVQGGNYSIKYDISTLPEGAYFIRMISGKQILTRQVKIVK